MKKTLTTIMAVLLIVTMVFAVVACDSDNKEHEHSFRVENKKAEYIKSEASCTTGTVIYYSCLCGEKGSETFELDNKTHNISKTYTDTNSLYHTTKATCRDCSAVVSETLELHTYSDGKNCAYCDHRKKSSEFKPGLYRSGTETLIYSWEELINEGILTVTEKAISGSNREMLAGDLVIPDSIEKISDMAFMDCGKLTRVSLPISLKEIASYAFAECDALENVVFPASLYSIDSHAFYSCDSFTSIELPNSVRTLNGFAFANCKNVTGLVLSSKVETLNPSVFMGMRSLTEITIPSSVTSIREYAFLGCYNLVCVEYEGTVEEWNAIAKTPIGQDIPASTPLFVQMVWLIKQRTKTQTNPTPPHNAGVFLLPTRHATPMLFS